MMSNVQTDVTLFINSVCVCVCVCVPRDREFDPDLVPYFRGDWT